METLPHLTGFRREVLTELQYAESRLLALAETVRAEDYGWAPATDARTFAAVLVHAAVGNLGLLDRANVHPPEAVELFAGIVGAGQSRVAGIVSRNLSLETTLTEKPAVIELLARSFVAVKACWTGASEEALWATGHFFGELETVRRLYLRILAHSHEHMGQAIAYARAMGYRVPWPDPARKLLQMEAGAVAR